MFMFWGSSLGTIFLFPEVKAGERGKQRNTHEVHHAKCLSVLEVTALFLDLQAFLF